MFRRILHCFCHFILVFEKEEVMSIDWSKQHCGVHQADYADLLHHMPDLKEILKTFPDDPNMYVWDVKVHMLMPGQYPCIPNWHYDNIPRVNNKQDFDLIQKDATVLN